jgi:hypothetical protein
MLQHAELERVKRLTETNSNQPVTEHRQLVVVSASKEVSKNTGQSQEQHKNAKDTHYNYINHALIAH